MIKVNKISLRQFRNIEKAEIEPCESINVLCGENGMGKTNLLEAVWLLCGAKSFRHSKDIQLVKKGCQRAKIEAETESLGVKRKISLEIGNRRRGFVHEKALKSPSGLTEFFSAVVFSPADITLASEGPAYKRRFMDVCLCSVYPKYLEALRNYQRALEQRNALLKLAKKEPVDDSLFDSLELLLCENGEVITSHRKDFTDFLNEKFNETYSVISGGKESVEIEYINKSSDSLLDLLKERRVIDIAVGSTTAGVHRDDIFLTMQDDSVREFSSQGQKRCSALALKLSEADYIARIKGEEPVILLDDVMSELDTLRQKQILTLIGGRQIFITCCDENNLSSLKDGKVFNIKDGAVI